MFFFFVFYCIQGYDPQMAYDMSYFRPVVDETLRGPGLPSSQEVTFKPTLWHDFFVISPMHALAVTHNQPIHTLVQLYLFSDTLWSCLLLLVA